MLRRLPPGRILAIGLGLLTLLAGCGNSRTPPPSTATPAPPSTFQTLTFRAAGVKLDAPSNWVIARGRGRLLTALSSGSAVVALWRFPRPAAQQSSTSALRLQARRLLGAARRRDPGFQLVGTKVRRIGDLPAVQINAFEQINGRRRRVLSTHVFARRAEIVLDEYAPPDVFGAVADRVFSPLSHSLQVSRTAS